MITSALLFLHLIFLILIFYKFYKKDSINAALLNTIFILVIFAVGWTLWAFIVNLIFSIHGKEINNDSITLLLLTLSEAVFYKGYYKTLIVPDKEKQ